MAGSLATVGTARGLRRVRPLALRIACAIVLASLAWASKSPVSPETPTIDPDFYARMAEKFGSVDLAPFSYRFLVPTLAGALPGSAMLGFVLIGAAAIVGSAWCCNAILRRRGFAGWPAELLVLVSPISWSFVRQPVTTDAFALGALALGLLAIDREKWGWVSVVMLVGVLGRETTGVLALSALFVAVEARGRRHGVVTAALVAIPSLVTLVAIRTTPLLYGRHLPGRLQLPEEIVAWRSFHDGGLLAALLGALAFSLGPVWVPAVRAVRRDPGSSMVALAMPAFLFVLPPLLFASDWSRLAAGGIVGAVLLAATCTSKTGMCLLAVGLAANSLLALFWSGGLGLPVLGLTIAVVTAGAASRSSPPIRRRTTGEPT